MVYDKSDPQATGAMLLRIKGEYLEMPGMRLTLAQARRLHSFDEITCDDLYAQLVASNFLSRTPDGSYVRADLQQRR